MFHIYPLFSIVTVTYNAGKELSATIESVRSQTCPLYEHIIVDGASTDNTLQIANAYADTDTRVMVMSKPDKGIYDAMNRGLSIANGDYLIFLNAGDRLHSPDTLQQLANAIMDNDYPGIVYGQTDLVDADGKYVGPRHLTAPETLTLDSFKDGMVVCHQAFVPNRSVVSLFNLNYRYSSDYEWCIICLMHSRRNVYVPQTIVDYLHEGMTTRHHGASLRERFQIMCTYYGRWTTIKKHGKFLLRHLMRKTR